MITIDFETYSEAGYIFNGEYFIPQVKGKPGIKAINAATYAQHPSTEIISLAYEDYLWIPGVNPPKNLFNYIADGGIIEAHNSLFEYYIWNCVGCARYGWPPLPLNQLRCSMAKARAFGLPGTLDMVSSILTPTSKKDPRGKQLIQQLSIPKRPTKKDPNLRRMPDKYPELYCEMYEYNKQDIVAEKAVSGNMPELSETELKVWQLDQKINSRGIQIDMVSLDACINIFEQCQERYLKELSDITGGQITSIGEISKGSSGDKWLQSTGVNLPSLNKENVAKALERPDLPKAARRVLEIRQILGSSSVQKLYAIKRMTNNDGRLRDLFAYCGAERTGRFCIAEGELAVVRLPNGHITQVPIEDVTLKMELWDGQEWVMHGGAVPAGMKKVITHDGVTGTKDHRVFTSTTEYDTLENVKKKNCKIFKGEKKCPITFTD